MKQGQGKPNYRGTIRVSHGVTSPCQASQQLSITILMAFDVGRPGDGAQSKHVSVRIDTPRLRLVCWWVYVNIELTTPRLGAAQAAQGSRRFQSLLKKLVKLFELNCCRFAWGFEATLGQLMRGSGGRGCIHMVPSSCSGSL